MRITRTELRGLRRSKTPRQGVQTPPGAPKSPPAKVIAFRGVRLEPDRVKTVWVPGRPVPQSRPRLGRSWRGKSQVHELDRVKAWKAAVAWHVKAAGVQVVSGPVEVGLCFVLEPGQRADLDNTIKSVLDALIGVAYHDDDQVVALGATKMTAGPGDAVGVRITVDTIG